MNKNNKILNMIIYFAIVVTTVLIDQITKILLYGKSQSLIGDFLWLESPALNTGAAFNMISNNLVLTIITCCFACLMIYVLISERFIKSTFFKISLSILLGGTIGNIIDRVIFGGVRDFIYLKSINFAIFNFADIFVNIGVYLVIGYFIYAIFVEAKNKNAKNGKSQNATATENIGEINNDTFGEKNINTETGDKLLDEGDKK